MNNLLPRIAFPCAFLATLVVIACAFVGPTATGPVPSPPTSIGPQPVLPDPDRQLVPTVQIATAKGWPQGSTPTPADGIAVNAFASGLTHPRWIVVLPNSDVLVAETNGPERPENGIGIRARVEDAIMGKAGAKVSSPNRITLLRDADGDGVAEFRSVFLENLRSPFGMALIGPNLYVANTDEIVRFPYAPGVTHISAAGARLTDLPGSHENTCRRVVSRKSKG
jgi:glucose/arabinose dehydrogenase